MEKCYKKVVKNTCFGGFNLSDIAVERYIQLKGLKLYHHNRSYYFVPFNIYKAELDNEHKLWESKSPEYRGHPSNRHCWDVRTIDREDEFLIQVVLEFGEKANGTYSELEIVEIPSDVKYKIHNEDGYETIREEHHVW